jgi:hypothetical protein
MTARTISSGTCQNFCGSTRRKRAGSIVVKVRPALLTSMWMPPNRDIAISTDAVAIGGPAQIGDERQDLPFRLGAGRLRLNLRDICVD